MSAANEPVPNYGIASDFPRLWEIALNHDFAERLGGSADPLTAEVDAALREIWGSRAAKRVAVQTTGRAD